MKRKAKKVAGRPEPFSGDRKLRGRIAGIPAERKTLVLDKHKDRAAIIEGECSKTSEFQSATKNPVAQAEKQEFKKNDDHTDMETGHLTIGEEDGNEDDLDEFDPRNETDGEEKESKGSMPEENETENTNELSDVDISDDELSDEDEGKMSSDDSSNETERSELGNDPCSNTKLKTPLTSKSNAGNTTNDNEEMAAGGILSGKPCFTIPSTKSTTAELEIDHHIQVKLPKPSMSINKTSNIAKEQRKNLAGKNGGALSRTRDSGELRTRAEVKNNLYNATMLTKPSIAKNNAGKATNEGEQIPAVKNGAQVAGKPTPAAESLPSSSKTHQHTEGKKNQPLTTAIGVIHGKNEIEQKTMITEKTGNAVSDLDSEEGAIEEGCDVESSDEDTTRLEVFDALGINGKQTEQKFGEMGSKALPILKNLAKPTPEPKKSFAQLFKAGNAEKKGYKLEYTRLEGDLELEEEDVGKTTEAWGHALVGYIAGKNPSYNAVIGYCKSWTHKCRVHFDASGWIVVKFEKEDDLKRVLEGGPYLIYGKPFIVKAMPKYFRYDKSEICKAQVWVNLPHLPLELWTERSLSKIGSRIGEPIQVDSITALRERASFARLLVEVDVSKDLIYEIDIVLPNKIRFTQKVRYEYIPTYCETCQALGHDTKMCDRRRKQAEDQRIRIRATAVSHKPNATSSELASLKVSENPTFDASTSKSSKAQITEKTTEDSEGEFVEYLSKNRKKMLAKGKKQVGFQGSLDIEEIGAGINKAAIQWQRKAIVPKETVTENGTAAPNPAGLAGDPVGSETENVDATHNPAGLADPVGSEALLAVRTSKLTVCALEAKSRVEENLGAVKPSVTDSNVVKGTRVVSHTTRTSLTNRDQKKGGNLPRSFR